MKKCWHCKNQFEFWKIRILIPDKFEENSPNFMKFGWVTKKLWLTIFVKSSVLDVWQCSEYASEFSCRRSLAWWGTYIPNTHEKSTKNQNVTEWCRCDKCRAMDKNVECLHCHQVDAVEYFEIWIAFFVVWLTDERHLALIPAGTIVRDPLHRDLQHAASRIWTCA